MKQNQGKQCSWVLEQPRSSLMELHPYLVELHSVLGAFGAEIQKPTKLKANVRWLQTLKPPKKATKALKKKDRKKNQGKKPKKTTDKKKLAKKAVNGRSWPRRPPRP